MHRLLILFSQFLGVLIVKKNYKKDFHKKLIKKIINIYEFCNEEINIFVLLLRKGNYPFEYMVAWKDLIEQHILIKKIFK